MKTYHLYTDGGARGNPGPAGIGAVLKTPEGELVEDLFLYIGEHTNNFAEYAALIEGLKLAREKECEEIEIFLDSELVVKQLNREYKVKDPDLAKLFVKAWNLLQEFKSFSISHIRREKNTEADALVNQALDNELKNNSCARSR